MGTDTPLLGLRLLHTRPVEDGDAVAQALLAAGATLLFAPMIRFLPPADPEALRLAVTSAASLILTSPRAVSAVSALVKADTRCFVLTGATQDKARQAGFTLVDVGPATDGESLGKAMVASGAKIPQPCVMPTSDVAQPAVAQVLRMVRENTVRATDGTDVLIRADTVCLHGDGAQPVEFARLLRRELTAAGGEIKACGT